MATVLNFENEEAYLEWESLKGNTIYDLQNSEGDFIGSLKEKDLLPLLRKGKVVSLDNSQNEAIKRFIELNYEVLKCNWGITRDDDIEVIDKILYIFY